MHQIVQRRGLCPRPYWGAHSAPPNPYLVKERGMREGEGKGREQEREEGTRETRGGCLLVNLSLAIRPWFACNVCQFIVRGAGLC